MFNLYYLIDQSVNADIGGAKNFVASFPDLQSAIAQAAADQVTHYSIEQTSSCGSAIVEEQ